MRISAIPAAAVTGALCLGLGTAAAAAAVNNLPRPSLTSFFWDAPQLVPGFALQEPAGYAATDPALYADPTQALPVTVLEHTSRLRGKLWTIDPADVARLKSEGKQPGGSEWVANTHVCVYSAPGAGRAAVYRYSKGGGGDWRYSLSGQAGFAGYQLDGLVFYLPQTPEKGLRALFIFFRPEVV